MKDNREEWYDAAAKVAVTVADVTTAAQQLARGHLCGPTSARCLAKGLAAVALLGAETSDPEETVSVQMKCSGPLGGLNVECTAAGTLRGYTEKKILDDFDGLESADDRRVLGTRQVQVTRSVPGKILSQGVSSSLDGYLAGSLQRKACLALAAVVSDDVQVRFARGVLVELMPDAPSLPSGAAGPLGLLGEIRDLSVAPRTLLRKLGLPGAELRKATPLSFACRCSPERAASMVAAIPPEERVTLPPVVDVTCHWCGRTYGVATGGK